MSYKRKEQYSIVETNKMKEQIKKIQQKLPNLNTKKKVYQYALSFLAQHTK